MGGGSWEAGFGGLRVSQPPPKRKGRRTGLMPRALFLALLAALGGATACDVDEPTAPVSAPDRPAADVVVSASLATLLGRATVDDQGNVGTFTSLVSSSNGAQHIAYRDETNPRLKYAVCFSNCTVAANWQPGVIDQSAGVGYWSSLKVHSGVRHVVYTGGKGTLKYARCSSNCLLEGNWIKDVIGAGVHSPSLTVGASGRLYVSAIRTSNGELLYATCLTDCTDYAKWEVAVVDPSSSPVPQTGTSIAVSSDGRRHITYERGGQLRYATCLASCTNTANWHFVTADQGSASVGYYSSLAVDANGVRRVSYYDRTNKDLKFARCAANCTNSAGWARVTVDKGAGVAGTTVGEYSSLAFADGKVHVSYYDRSGGRLKYAKCGADCLQSGNWTRQTVDGGCNAYLICTDVGRFTSLKLGGGKVHISHYNFTKGDLRYTELAP
jgi:hypothetical protein